MPLHAGDRIGPYEVIGTLGAGGMGEVYRARDDRLDRDVAVKVLPAGFADEPAAPDRFEREAKVVAALAHPNIVAIYDFGRDAGRAYAVMELVEGETLRERLSQGPLPTWKAAELARQVARALGAAHERGIAHRDLKPENIIIDRQGQAKVLDFGLAAAVGDGGDASSGGATRTGLTAPGTVMGTVGYMSPEQVRGETVDHRTDIFSFGCVLYEMLTGARAFQRDTSAETMTAILREEPPEITPGSGTIAPALWRVVRRCLEKRPDERFQSARDLAFAIDNAATASDSQPKTVAPAPASTPRTGWMTGGLLAVLGVVAGFAIASAFRSPTTTEPARVRRLTVSGTDREPTASPDGSMVAFTSTRDGTPRIWIKQLAGGGEEPRTAGPDSFPSFSPDGSTLLFQRDEGRTISVYRQALVGGQARKVVSDALMPAWSPDGASVVFLRPRVVDGTLATTLAIADAQTGDERILVRFDIAVWGPTWSPDGRTIAVVQASATGISPDYRLLLIDVDTGTVDERTVGGGRPLSYPVWTGAHELTFAIADSLLGDLGSLLSRFVHYQPGSGAVTTLFWTEHLFPLSGLRVDFSRVAAIGDDGLVFNQVQERQNLREVTAGATTGGERVLTRSEGRDRQPVYSPDGRRVVFSSNRAGNLDLWTLELETGVYRQLTDDEAQDWDPGFTPDGREIVWSSDRAGHLEIWIANADGSNARQLTHDGTDAENPSVGGNGDWVLYWSANPEKPGVWKIRRDGSEATRLLAGSVNFAESSPDGRYAAYVTISPDNRNTIHFLDVAAATPLSWQIEVPTPLRATNIILGRPRWMPDGRSIAWVGTDERNRTGVYVQDFAPDRDTSASRRPLAGFSPDWATESFGISPDGTRVSLAVLEQTARLMLAEDVPDSR